MHEPAKEPFKLPKPFKQAWFRKVLPFRPGAGRREGKKGGDKGAGPTEESLLSGPKSLVVPLAGGVGMGGLGKAAARC